MIRRHPKLRVLPLLVAALLLPIGLAKLFGGDHDLWSLLCLVLFFLGLWLLNPIITGLEVDLEFAERDRRLEPVKRSVETCWLMTERREIDYRHKLVQELLRSLNVAAKPEAPLLSGTRVDAYLEFGDADWYITIKRGLNNQKRLILQGEIEDIILHSPRKDRDLWICVVVGLSDGDNDNELAHSNASASTRYTDRCWTPS